MAVCALFVVMNEEYFASVSLGACAKLRKATFSFVTFVRLPVRAEQHGCHFTDFHEIWYLNIFRKSVEKI
jgi:dipeptidase